MSAFRFPTIASHTSLFLFPILSVLLSHLRPGRHINLTSAKYSACDESLGPGILASGPTQCLCPGNF